MNKPLTSKTLNETLAKKFGTKIDVDSFTLEQLQDARNKMRTKQFDIETNESFSGLSQNRTYSKNKLFLDVLNAAISERSDIAEAQSAAQKAAFQKMLAKKKGAKPAAKDTKDKNPKDGKMPMDDNGTPGNKSDDKPAFLKVLIRLASTLAGVMSTNKSLTRCMIVLEALVESCWLTIVTTKVSKPVGCILGCGKPNASSACFRSASLRAIQSRFFFICALFI